MGEQKQKNANKADFIFHKKNYTWLFIGLAFIIVGFLVMSLGYDFRYAGSHDDPNFFDPDIFRWDRIRLAPTLVLIGFGVQVYAILLHPNSPKKS